MDLKARLAALDRLTRRPGEESSPRAPAGRNGVSSEARETVVAGLGLEPRDLPGGRVWVREYRDSLSSPPKVLPDFSGFFSHPGEAGIALAEVLFLDTETTGLAGGTGTLPFLVGVSRFADDHFYTTQFFLPGPEHEAALLAALAGVARGFRAVISFNGASFDLPLLRNRSLLNRVDDPLAELVSWDLLVPARRLWKGVLPDCRQQTVEQWLSGRPRGEGDVDGSRIPGIWFDFLDSGEAGPLERVLRHNHRDMVGMGEIFTAVSEAAMLVSPDGESEDDAPAEPNCWRRCWSLGRICERRRDDRAGARWLLRAFTLARDDVPGEELAPFLGDVLRVVKRTGDHAMVERIIQRGLAAAERQDWLHREAAILYEHRLPRLQLALDHARKAGDFYRVARLLRRTGQEVGPANKGDGDHA